MIWAIIYGGILVLVCLCCWAPRDLRRKPADVLPFTNNKPNRK